jgi:predicted esterase
MKPPIDTPPPGVEAQPGEDPPERNQPEENPTGENQPAENQPGGAPRSASPRPGYYELEVVGVADAPPVKYLVQLPPEYDPYRRYPAIVTLHGARSTPALQIDWWAGAWAEGGWRRGQATRHGYIVIAPQWAAEHQRKYGYSLREHAAVLSSLRDACRRFSIDTDRVFLTGHSMGGDAAWDIGLAHPDLWAGVIPIVARSDKYCLRYWKNAKLVPFYFVCGELDGNRMSVNAVDFDRYFKHFGYNCTVVEYLGRGHDSYSDEIQRLFDWMSRFKRDFFPREFATSTMRRWDNFFWWVELEELPPRATVEPVDWPPPSGTRAAETTASITVTGAIYVRSGAGSVTVWLSPEMIDFQQPVNVVVNRRRLTSARQFVEPDLETLLEDVLLRGDRQHPFWAKMEP